MSQVSESEKIEEKKSKSKARKIASWCAVIFAFALCAGLLIHSLLCMFMDGYYPTFGGYRLMAIVSDSMEPEIPTGDMIVTRVPTSVDEIGEGTVITFEIKDGKSTVLITHRVTAVHTDAETGGISYTTKGDNAERADTVHPEYSDVVGIYTGKKCGFFGYLFGFLQSSQGAIALIVILLVIALAVIVVKFINVINTWRGVALAALEKSGVMLNETDNVSANTVADVLGIVTRDPKNRVDLKRKNKKLERFMHTGTLPRRPYADDIDEHADPTSQENIDVVGDGEKEQPPRPSSAENILSSAPQQAETPVPPPEEDKTETVPEAPAPVDIVESLGEVAATTQAAVSANEKVRYEYTFRARLIQAKSESKEFYSVIKNEFMSYAKVAAEDGKSFEKYTLGKKMIARVSVRGKTLNVSLALDPEKYADSKYRITVNKTNTPVKLKITSKRQTSYAIELITEMMTALGAVKKSDYEPQDYYMPYEGIASLLSKGLVWRKKTTVPRVVEECERLSYDLTFSARLCRLEEDGKQRYSTVKNELLSYDNVRCKEGKRGETYMIGRKTVAKINVRGKTVCLMLALDPQKYANAKYKVTALNNPKTPLKYRLTGEERTAYALELIADLMAGEGVVKNAEYAPSDFRPQYDNIVSLMNKGLAKRKLTNKTQEFAVELVKKK